MSRAFPRFPAGVGGADAQEALPNLWEGVRAGRKAQGVLLGRMR